MLIFPPLPFSPSGAAGAAAPQDESPKGGRLNKKAKIAIIVAAAAVVIIILAVVIVVVSSGSASSLPSDEQIQEDILSNSEWNLATGGSYGTNATYEDPTIEVTSKERYEEVEDYLKLLGVKAVCSAQATGSTSNGSVDASCSFDCLYIKTDGEWELFSCDAGDTTYTATAGVAEDVVAAKAADFLDMADEHLGATSLENLYEDVTPTVESVDFDEEAQTTTATLLYDNSTAFSDLSATITVDFVFDSGGWELGGATADEDAYTVSYDKLIGTWTGSFESQECYDSHCYGAEDQALTLTIDSIDPDSLKVTGTVKGLAHYHEASDGDEDSDKGDEVVELEFTGTLDTGTCYDYSLDFSSTPALWADCTWPEDDDGQLTLVFSFGLADEPEAAEALLITEANYTVSSTGGSITANGVDTYTDLYTLEQSE